MYYHTSEALLLTLHFTAETDFTVKQQIIANSRLIVLTPINVALKVGCNTMASIIVFQV